YLIPCPSVDSVAKTHTLSTINSELIRMSEQTSQSTRGHVAISASQARGDIAPKTLSLAEENTKIAVQNLNLYYGNDRALNDIKLAIPENRVTAFIGPSGCGKS